MRAIFQRRYLFHLFFWLMYLLFMVLENQYYVKNKGWGFSLMPISINLLLMMFLVYVHTLVLIPYLLDKKKIIFYVLCILALVALNVWLKSFNQKYWDGIVWPDEPMQMKEYFPRNTLYAVWFILLSSMLLFSQKWSEQRQQVKNIQINQLQTELKYLRAQVNPHFLFNGLNTIYGNIDMNNQQARNILLLFADLLRYNLYEADVDWVDLEKETLYLQNYVSLQRARSNSNLVINLDIDIKEKNVKVAPLIFIAFIENAFKFSTRDDNKINNINIRLQQSGNRIIFECSNSYENNEEPSGGIGLNNVKRRLELLYKDRYTLDIKKEEHVYSVKLILTV